MLEWTENGNNLEAAGRNGWYLIKRVPGFTGCILTATGHDALPMLAIPPFGKPFERLQYAKDFAARLDRVRVAEPFCGGE